MTDLQIEINNRYNHINQLLEYIKLLEKYDDNIFLRDKLLKTKGSKEYYVKNKITEEWEKIELKFKVKKIDIDFDLMHILKSNLILMSYNLIEFIVRNLLDDVYREIWNYKYIDLKDNIRKKVSRDFNKASKDHISNEKLLDDVFKLSDIKKEINKFWYDMIKISWKSNNHLGWNITYKTLDDISKSYCFDLPSQSRSSKHIHLGNFKSNRNKLAHWNNSFIEIWKLYTISRLEKEIKETINYLSSLQVKVTDYINKKDFLA